MYSEDKRVERAKDGSRGPVRGGDRFPLIICAVPSNMGQVAFLGHRFERSRPIVSKHVDEAMKSTAEEILEALSSDVHRSEAAVCTQQRPATRLPARLSFRARESRARRQFQGRDCEPAIWIDLWKASEAERR